MDMNRMEGTPEQLAAWLGRLPHEKRYRLVEVEEVAENGVTTPQVSPNEGMLAALREISERQKGRRHTDGSQTERMLREGRAGAMWGHDPSK